MTYPTSAAAMSAAVGYGTWSNGWLCEESSGDLLAAFGSTALAAAGSPTYGTTGPFAADKAITIANGDAGTSFSSSSIAYPGANDMVLAFVVRPNGPTTANLIASQSIGQSGGSWNITRAAGPQIKLSVGDGTLNRAIGVAYTNATWYVVVACIDRAAANLAMAITSDGSTATSSSLGLSTLGSVGSTGAFSLGLANAISALGCDYAGVYYGAGAGVAASLSANIQTAANNLYNALNKAALYGPPQSFQIRPFGAPYQKPGQFAKTQWNGPREVIAPPILLAATIDPEIAGQSNPTPGARVTPFGPPWLRPGQFARTNWNGPREVIAQPISVTATLDVELIAGINTPAISGAVYLRRREPPWQKPGQFAKTQWNGPREVVAQPIALAATISPDARGYNPARLKAGWFGPWFPKRGRNSWWAGWFPEARGSLVLASIPGQAVVDPSTAAGAATLALVLEDGCKVKYSYSTDVEKSQHGNELRVSKLTRPVEHYSGGARVVGDDVRSLRALIGRFAPLGSAFLLGLPHEGTTLVANSSGLVVFTGPTMYLDWAIPGVRCVCIGSNRALRVECVVQAVGATSITLDVATGATGAAGGSLMPAVPVFLDPQQTFDRYTPAEPVETWQISARAAGFGYLGSGVAAALSCSQPKTTGAALQGLTYVSRAKGLAQNAITIAQVAGGALGVVENVGAKTVVVTFVGSTTTADQFVSIINAQSTLVAIDGTFFGSSIKKTGGAVNTWDSGASSVQSIAGDGYVEWTVGEAGAYRIVGLSTSDPDQSNTTITFGAYADNNIFLVFESGSVAANCGALAAGDVLRVQRTGITITYRQNGALKYTSLITSSAPLRIDSSFFTSGSTATNIHLVDSGADVAVTWQNVVNITVTPGATLVAGLDEFAATAMVGGIDGALGAIGVGSSVTLYAGVPLYDRALISNGTVSDSIQTLSQIQDFGGVPFVTTDSDQADWGRHIVAHGMRGIDFQWFKHFLAFVRGAQVAFWLPTYRCDLVVLSNTSTTITISSANFLSWYQSPFFRTQVAVIQTDNTMTPAQLTSVVDNGNSTFTLTIPITSFLSAVPIKALSWLELVRLESDDAEVTFTGAAFAAELQARVVQL